MLKSVKTQSIAIALACSLAWAACGEDTVKQIAVPAGDLLAAIEMLQQQSDVQVVYNDADLRGIRTPGANGSLTTQEAVKKLLQGTALRLSTDSTTGAMLIVRAEEPTASATAGASQGEVMKVAQANESSAGSAATSEQDRDGSRNASESAGAAQDTQLEEIVVTAQKRLERLQDVPISISVLGGEDLDRSTDRGVAEALNRVPGVVNLPLAAQGRFGGQSNVVVRGVAGGQLGTSSSTTGYYLDSIPFAFVRQNFAPDSSAFDLERVEVLRGPQGTLYGASALNGVVRVLTRDANLDRFELKARTSVSGTENGAETYRGDVAVNVPIVSGKLAARAVVGYQDIGGWIDKAIQKDADDRQIGNARLKINAQPTERLSLSLLAWLSRTDAGAPSHSANGLTSLSVVDESAAIDYDAYGFKLNYDFPRFSLTSMTSYIDFINNSNIDISAIAPGTIRSIFASRVFSEEINLSSNYEGPWRWTLGAIYRDAEDTQWQLRSVAYLAPQDQRSFSESFAGFGELTRAFADGRFELTGGLRYFEDRARDVERSNLSLLPLVATPWNTFDDVAPRVVLTWHPSGETSLYASYGEGFRSGLNQLAPVTRAAPEYPPAEPDELKNYEVGAKGSFWGGRVNFDAAAFYMDWTQVQQAFQVVIAPPNVRNGAIVNASSASGPGFEFGATVVPVSGLTLGANLSWNDLKVDEDVINASSVLVIGKDDRLLGSAETTASVSADYLFPLGGAGWNGQFSVSTNYVSSLVMARTVVGESTRGSAMLTRTSFALVSPNRWTTSLFVDNLGKERGYTADPSTPQWAAYLRPRTIGLQLEYQFGRQ